MTRKGAKKGVGLGHHQFGGLLCLWRSQDRCITAGRDGRTHPRERVAPQVMLRMGLLRYRAALRHYSYKPLELWPSSEFLLLENRKTQPSPPQDDCKVGEGGLQR